MPRPRASRYQKDATEHLEVRARLLDILVLELERLNLWNTLAASVLGVSQQRANTLLQRRLELFNSETLIVMLARVGIRVEVAVTERRRVRIWDFKR